MSTHAGERCPAPHCAASWTPCKVPRASGSPTLVALLSPGPSAAHGLESHACYPLQPAMCAGNSTVGSSHTLEAPLRTVLGLPLQQVCLGPNTV